jgi:hypothetical protein
MALQPTKKMRPGPPTHYSGGLRFDVRESKRSAGICSAPCGHIHTLSARSKPFRQRQRLALARALANNPAGARFAPRVKNALSVG